MKKSTTVMAPETVEEAHSIIKAQLNQIKLLAAENDYKNQQLNSQKEKIIELEKGISIYKQQVTNLETKLRLYDQELKLKLNTLIDKNNKLVQQNQYLMNQAQGLVMQNKQLQEQKIYAENEYNRLAIETDQIKQKHMYSEDAFFREQERSRIKEDEIETLEDTMHQLTAENQELKRRVDQLQRNLDE
jgi:chromosome segregation ATPase